MKRLLIAFALLLLPTICQAQYRGDVPLGETLNFTFNTLGSDGAPITIAGTPAIEVYEEGGTTQITAGTTLTEDFDSVTGLHNVAIVATSGNGYEAGKWYDIVIGGTTPTADSVSILGRTLGQFRVVVAENVAGTPAVDFVLFEGATPDLATDSEIADTVWDEAVAGHTTAGTYGNYLGTTLPDEFTTQGGLINGVGTQVGSIETDIATMQGNVTSILGYTDDIGVAGAGLTAITGVHLDATQPQITSIGIWDTTTAEIAATISGTIDANVVSAAVGALEAEDFAGDVTFGVDAAGIRAALGMSAADLDTQLALLETEIGAISSTASPILQFDIAENNTFKFSGGADGVTTAQNTIRMSSTLARPRIGFNVRNLTVAKPAQITNVEVLDSAGSTSAGITVAEEDDTTNVGVRDWLLMTKVTGVTTSGTYSIRVTFTTADSATYVVQGSVVVP